MSEYSIKMSPEVRKEITSIEEMPEYSRVIGFLDKWELSLFLVWSKVGMNEKFKAMVQSIRMSIHMLEFYRDHNLNKMPARYIPFELTRTEGDFILKNLDNYRVRLKNAARLIEMFEEKEDFYLERDRISEAAITYDFRIRYFLEYGDEDKIEL